MILSYNLKIKIYGYHYIHAVCLLFSRPTAYSIIVTVLNELLLLYHAACLVGYNAIVCLYFFRTHCIAYR